jgi:phosphatidate cytidylyltransferase
MMPLPLAGDGSALRDTLALFGGLGAVLALASGVGACLKWRVARRAPHAVIDNLNARINAWWVMIGLIGLAFALGQGGVLGLFALASAAALSEFLRIDATPARPGDRLAHGVCFLVILPLHYALLWRGGPPLAALLLIPVGAFLLLPLLSLRGGGGFAARVPHMQWGLMSCVFCLSHVPALWTLSIPGQGEGRQALLVAFVILVVQASDVLQYIWGKLLGRRRLAPSVSPSKTWEGMLGGVGSASLLGAALWWLTPFTPWQAGALAFAACAMGVVGGLVMSAFKRDRGIKDWGTLIEGHGGVLDRIDSLCFAAPVFFYLVRWGWAA